MPNHTPPVDGPPYTYRPRTQRGAGEGRAPSRGRGLVQSQKTTGALKSKGRCRPLGLDTPLVHASPRAIASARASRSGTQGHPSPFRPSTSIRHFFLVQVDHVQLHGSVAGRTPRRAAARARGLEDRVVAVMVPFVASSSTTYSARASRASSSHRGYAHVHQGSLAPRRSGRGAHSRASLRASAPGPPFRRGGHVENPAARTLSRDRTRCPRCPASRCTTRCRHRQAAVARVPRRARPVVRTRPRVRPGALHPRARCRPARQDAPGS